jgi:hypothetical protein
MTRQPEPLGPDDIFRTLSPARIVTAYSDNLAIEWKLGGTKTYRVFLHASVSRMNHEAIMEDIQRGDWIIYTGAKGFAWMGPTSAVLTDYPSLANGPHDVAIPIFTQEDFLSTESKSWFELATFFLARDIREAVRGDILETRARMARRGYHRVWIEAVTVVEVARSLGASWSSTIQTLMSVLRRIFGD